MNRYQKAIKYTKPSTNIDEKIDRLNEMMTTTGMYTVVNTDGGVEEQPPEFNPPNLGDLGPDDFQWPDQGDGSDPDNLLNLGGLSVTDTLGKELPLYDYLPGVNYDGWKKEPDYSLYGGKIPYAIVYDGRALASTRLFYLSDNGLNLVMQIGAYTTPGPYTDLQKEFSDWYYNADKSNLTTQTIYIWGPLQTLVGGWYGAGQYYPAHLSNTSDPKADRALYAYTMYVPGTGNRNYASDPGVRVKPPSVTNVVSRDDLGDANYYPGPVTNVSPEALNYLIARSGFPRNAADFSTRNVRGPYTPVKYYPGMGFGPAGPVVNPGQGGFSITPQPRLANSYEPDGEVLSEEYTLTKNDFALLNKYVKDHPEELEYAFKRYPASDPRLSQLNWKMDDMMNASNEYIDKQFPENVEQTSRVKKILARNIELSDPKTFKDPKPALTYSKLYGDKPRNEKVKQKDFSKKSAGRFFRTEKKKDTSRTRWLKG